MSTRVGLVLIALTAGATVGLIAGLSQSQTCGFAVTALVGAASAQFAICAMVGFSRAWHLSTFRGSTSIGIACAALTPLAVLGIWGLSSAGLLPASCTTDYISGGTLALYVAAAIIFGPVGGAAGYGIGYMIGRLMTAD